MDLEAVFILMVIFGSIITIIYLQIRKKERMALLQSGKDASFFDSNNKKTTTSSSSLKYGLLLVGVGLGILIANILVASAIMGEDVAYFSMIFIFGGIALLTDFFISRNHAKTKK
ncbi:MAG: DUF6249 domain-containing protein [Bacteroidota bacterium]|nr:DUF6249 domain-containing protein [Bacteroidota bacterium]